MVAQEFLAVDGVVLGPTACLRRDVLHSGKVVTLRLLPTVLAIALQEGLLIVVNRQAVLTLVLVLGEILVTPPPSGFYGALEHVLRVVAL